MEKSWNCDFIICGNPDIMGIKQNWPKPILGCDNGLSQWVKAKKLYHHIVYFVSSHSCK